MIDGLSNFLDEKGTVGEKAPRQGAWRVQRVGRSRPQPGSPRRSIPRSASAATLCYVACRDTSVHWYPHRGRAAPLPAISADARQGDAPGDGRACAVGGLTSARLQPSSHVCPAPGCITMIDDARQAVREARFDRDRERHEQGARAGCAGSSGSRRHAIIAETESTHRPGGSLRRPVSLIGLCLDHHEPARSVRKVADHGGVSGDRDEGLMWNHHNPQGRSRIGGSAGQSPGSHDDSRQLVDACTT